MGKHPIISYPPYDTLATCQKKFRMPKKSLFKQNHPTLFSFGECGMYTRVQLGAMQLSNGCMRAGAALAVMQKKF